MMDGREIADRLYGRPALPREDRPDDGRFEHYVGQYSAWAEVAASLPHDVAVDAAAAAFRDEARRRRATRPRRSETERRAER